MLTTLGAADYRRAKFGLTEPFWLKDDGHVDPDSLPPPDEVALEIVENLELALERFRSVAAQLQPNFGS